jgi:hypothetical protein
VIWIGFEGDVNVWKEGHGTGEDMPPKTFHFRTDAANVHNYYRFMQAKHEVLYRVYVYDEFVGKDTYTQDFIALSDAQNWQGCLESYPGVAGITLMVDGVETPFIQ